MDYFALLGLPPAFDIDLQALESAYFTQQRLYHPDRFIGRPPAERQQGLQRSIDINKAYNTLKNPLPRAQYLLHLQGIEVGTDRDTVKPSQSLLLEVMEWHEERPGSDAVAEMAETSERLIAGYYASGNWEAMAHETLRLGYLVKAERNGM